MKIKIVSIDYDESRISVDFKIVGANLPVNITESIYHMDLGQGSQKEVLRQVKDLARRTVKSLGQATRKDLDELKDKEVEVEE